jgi:hypothetical protein
MLRVTIDLVPHGDESRKKTLSEITIINTLIKNVYGEYTYKYSGWFKELDDSETKKFNGKVEHWRENVIWLLLFKIINKLKQPYETTTKYT